MLQAGLRKVVADMQRIIARNPDFEANKLAPQQRKPLAAAKEHVQKMKVHAQEVIDQFDRLLNDLQSKPMVRRYVKKAEEPPLPKPRQKKRRPPL